MLPRDVYRLSIIAASQLGPFYTFKELETLNGLQEPDFVFVPDDQKLKK